MSEKVDNELNQWVFEGCDFEDHLAMYFFERIGKRMSLDTSKKSESEMKEHNLDNHLRINVFSDYR
tara:strand:- start:1149 stop:1346 length:198 start_codon:yes stop_codon:yes gene_type:complete